MMEESPNTGNIIEERLWNYIDGNLPAAERSVIEKLLQSDATWQLKYSELLEVNKILRNSELDAPSMRFTKNVMEEIAKLHIGPATRTYINNRIIWAIGLFFIMMIIGFLIYGFGQVNWSEGESKSFLDKVNKVDIGKFFNNTWVNVFMMINVVLGLFLLDNYLGNKRKAFKKEA
jgi:hypothetical protein